MFQFLILLNHYLLYNYMIKKEESSVKLDLGAEEESEEEEEEEQEEESEKEQEDEKVNEESGEEEDEDEEDEESDAGLVDFDFGDGQNEEFNIVVKNDNNLLQGVDQPALGRDGDHQPVSTLKNQFKNIQQKEREDKSGHKRKKGQSNGEGYLTTPKSQHAFQKLFYTQSPNSEALNKIDSNENKTVFTKISEDLFNKFISNKHTQNQKTSAYDYLISDMFLNKIVEKNDKNAGQKFSNFAVRNKDFRDKKNLKLKERIEKIANEAVAECTWKPNGKNFEKSEVRKPEDYYNDHLKYIQTRDANITHQKEEILKNTEALLKVAPEISKKTKRIAARKLKKENISKNVHDRLFKERLNKEKKHIYPDKKEKDPSKKKNKKSKAEYKTKRFAQKKSKEEVKNLVEKLHKEATELKINKEKLATDKQTLKEVHNLYHSDDEITTPASNLKILENFVKNYELAMLNRFNRKDSIYINFEDFCNLILDLGFIKYDHHNAKGQLHSNEGEDNKDSSSKENKEKASILRSKSQITPEMKEKEKKIRSLV